MNIFLQEQKTIKADSDRLLHLESQIQPNKADEIKPVHPPVQAQPPKFTSEPMTIRMPANSQGRQLVIDPRNEVETEYGNYLYIMHIIQNRQILILTLVMLNELRCHTHF